MMLFLLSFPLVALLAQVIKMHLPSTAFAATKSALDVYLWEWGGRWCYCRGELGLFVSFYFISEQ